MAVYLLVSRGRRVGPPLETYLGNTVNSDGEFELKDPYGIARQRFEVKDGELIMRLKDPLEFITGEILLAFNDKGIAECRITSSHMLKVKLNEEVEVVKARVSNLNTSE